MILDGKKLKNRLLNEYRDIVRSKSLHMKLSIIRVGVDDASSIYIRNKQRACEFVGVDLNIIYFSEKTTNEKIAEVIDDLNKDPNVTGIIIQSPIPSHLDYEYLTNLIDPKKDVDGFTKENIYNLYLNKDTLMPCTVKGIIKLLEYNKIELKGKNVLIIGRGNIVGKPLSLALENKDATVTLAHSNTVGLSTVARTSDIIICACGVPKLVNSSFVNEKSIVIDVGISYVDGKIVGDVDYEDIKDKVLYITPNPGGVGPLTVAMIIDNLIELRSKYGQDIDWCVK